ncbi:hypothetical protein GBL_0847 [Geobacillus kaustophilus GBlys]|uniref:Uncharacterized protein n=1 Tax=Geobacillus kaustophilus GBlys TaxID=1337888 RepID=U2X1Z1_GEOKU|nr:hypothetical protein GBL_0847 [Geobacillus kaustophilus GBlys]
MDERSHDAEDAPPLDASDPLTALALAFARGRRLVAVK